MRLTIVIPALNRDYCVARAIDSALAQTSPDIEVLVSNNGSTDRTREVLDRYSDPRLRVFHHETTMSMADHANFLIRHASGELFLGLSDDDYLEPTFAERVLALFKRVPEISFAYTRVWTHVRDAAMPSAGAPEIEDTLDFFENYFAGLRHVFWCGCVTRTADLRRLGGQPVGVLIGDMYFWTQLAFDGPIGCISEPLSHYTYLVDNASVGIPVCQWAGETQRLIERISKRLSALSMDPRRRDRLVDLMAKYLARTTANQFVLNAIPRGAKASVIRGIRFVREASWWRYQDLGASSCCGANAARLGRTTSGHAIFDFTIALVAFARETVIVRRRDSRRRRLETRRYSQPCL
jgi:hypothetical protein